MYICDKMKSLLAILCLLSCFPTWAQYDVETLTMPDTRNTVGFNLTPAALVLFNGLPINTRFSAVYKRQIDVSQRLRATLNYTIEDRYFDLRNDTPLNFSDTTITFLLESEDNYGLDLRLGMEYFKPNRKTTMVYGFDAIIGYYTSTSIDKTQPLYISPICNCSLPSPFVLAEERSAQIEYLTTGVDFSIGQQLNLNDYMNFTIQWMPTLMLKMPIKETYSEESARLDPAQNDHDFNLRGFELFFNYIF